MLNKKAYIISLKFAPGLKKEFTLIGERARAKGINVEYLLARNYKFIGNSFAGMQFISNSNNLIEILCDSLKIIVSKGNQQYFDNDRNIAFVLFYNPHILNLFIARYIKNKGMNIRTVLFFHDPFKPDKRPYGLVKMVYISIVEFIQKLTLRYIDYIISPSKYSYKLFRDHYGQYQGQVHIAPLLIPDQSGEINLDRELFSLVGTYHKATGHDTFIELVNYVAAYKLDYKFALISSSNISNLINNLSAEGHKYVEIINKNIIDDSEINNLISQSYAVFRLDREVTQSGVVAVANMNGTPIIARDIPGLAQHVRHDYNGYLVPADCVPQDLIYAMDQVKKNFIKLSQNSRNSYEEIWSEINFDKYYKWLILL